VAVKKSGARRRPQLVPVEEFCSVYAGGIHHTLYYRGVNQSPPRFPPPVKGIPLADVQKWMRTQGMEFAKARAEFKARHPKQFSKGKAAPAPSTDGAES
jgi:hypothetical protein